MEIVFFFHSFHLMNTMVRTTVASIVSTKQKRSTEPVKSCDSREDLTSARYIPVIDPVKSINNCKTANANCTLLNLLRAFIFSMATFRCHLVQ